MLPQKYLSMTTGHLNYSPIFELIIVTAIPFTEQQNPRVRDTGPSNSLQKSSDLKKDHLLYIIENELLCSANSLLLSCF